MKSPNFLKEADRVAEILSIVGNAKRLRILCHLLSGELSVGAIAARVDLSQSALSQHLAKLRALDLVQTRRDRQTIYYSCGSPEIRELILCLEEIFAAPAADEDNVRSFRKKI